MTNAELLRGTDVKSADTFDMQSIGHIGASALLSLTGNAYMSRSDYRALKYRWDEPCLGSYVRPLRGYPGGIIGKHVIAAMQADARILVVDDEPQWREAIAESLGDRGHDVTCANSAAEGVRALQKQQFDGVTIDGLNGDWPQVYNTAGQQGARPLVISGDDRIAGQVGNDNFMSKGHYEPERFSRIWPDNQ